MALTPAERQAIRRDRIQKTLDDLAAANAALVAQLQTERDTTAALRAENEALKNRAQAGELAALKAQVRELKKTAPKRS